jgi:HK97 family phage major capsid protein
VSKFPALEELEGRIKTKSDALSVIFTEAGDDLDMTKVKSIPGDTFAKAEHIRQANDELTDLGKQRDQLLAVQKAAERARTAPVEQGAKESGSEPGSKPTSGRQTKSFGQMFVESKAYKEKTGSAGPESTLDIELKTLFQTSAGWDPEEIRTTTSQSAVTYMEETTFTNTAAEVLEGGLYPEATLALTEQSSLVRKVSVWLPVTDEQLEDEPQARGYIDNRLPFMVRQRLDSQLLVGNGTAPNLRGFLNVVGIQTQAKGTDPTPDAVYKALTKVRTGTGQAMPDAVVFNPNDWQDVRLLRTADGLYIWGNPSDAGPERIWGQRVVLAQALTENTALVGDFGNFSELAVRRGIDVQVSNSHDTFFINGKQALRADIRVALVVYRPAAFCQVTGI